MLPARRLSGDVRSRGVRPARRTLSVLLPLALAACAAAAPPPAEAPGAELLLLGGVVLLAEQHAIEARTVGRLADEGRLAALAASARGSSTESVRRGGLTPRERTSPDSLRAGSISGASQ